MPVAASLTVNHPHSKKTGVLLTGQFVKNYSAYSAAYMMAHPVPTLVPFCPRKIK
jgi:hypothetical protein